MQECKFTAADERETMREKIFRHDEEIKELQRQLLGGPKKKTVELWVDSLEGLRSLGRGSVIRTPSGLYLKEDGPWVQIGDNADPYLYESATLMHMYGKGKIEVLRARTPESVHSARDQVLAEMRSLKETLITRVQFALQCEGFGPRTYDAGLVEGLSIATMQLQRIIDRWES